MPKKPQETKLFSDAGLAFELAFPGKVERKITPIAMPESETGEAAILHSLLTYTSADMFFCNVIQYPADHMIFHDSLGLQLGLDRSRVQMGVDSSIWIPLLPYKAFPLVWQRGSG